MLSIRTAAVAPSLKLQRMLIGPAIPNKVQFKLELCLTLNFSLGFVRARGNKFPTTWFLNEILIIPVL